VEVEPARRVGHGEEQGSQDGLVGHRSRRGKMSAIEAQPRQRRRPGPNSAEDRPERARDGLGP
jgi:hypothetical protein